MVREGGVVQEGVFFKEGDGGLAELVERRAVADGCTACEFSAQVDAVREDVVFLRGCELGCALSACQYHLIYHRSGLHIKVEG